MKASVYVFCDADGDAIYVGVTTAGPARLRNHRVSKDWFAEAASAWFEHFDDAAEAYVREAELIKELRPRYNIASGTLLTAQQLRNRLGSRGERYAEGERFREARRAAVLTQEELAEALGLRTGRTVQRWEAGEALPHPQQVRAFAKLTGRDPGWFYGFDKNEEAA